MTCLKKSYVFWCLETVKTDFSFGVDKIRTDVQTNPGLGADQTMDVAVIQHGVRCFTHNPVHWIVTGGDKILQMKYIQ